MIPPLLLAGPPGSGKTWLARQLAVILSGQVTRLYPCGGLNNAIPLRGQSRSFQESGPSVVVDLLAQHRSAAGCMVWDEIDKVGTSTWNGDPLHALIQMLETETSSNLHDDFLQTQVNLGLVNHIATANRIDGLPAPLLSRFHIVDVRPPDLEAMHRIVASFQIDLARRFYVREDAVPVLDEMSIERILRANGRSIDIRDMKRRYEAELLRRLEQVR